MGLKVFSDYSANLALPGAGVLRFEAEDVEATTLGGRFGVA